MTPSQFYEQEKQNGKLKAEIKNLLSTKALSRYEAEELIQLNVLNEIERPRKINQSEIKKVKENHNLTSKEKLDIISHLYRLNGFEIVDRTKLGLKLFKKKKFSYLSAFLWFLFLGVGLIIYILYYLLKGDDNLSITVEDNYKIKPDVLEEDTEEIELITLDEDIDEELEEVDELSKDEDENLEEDRFEETKEVLETQEKTEEEKLLEELGSNSESIEEKPKTAEEKLLEELNQEDDIQELEEDKSQQKEKTAEEKLLEELAGDSDLSEEKKEEKPKTAEEKLLEELSR